MKTFTIIVPCLNAEKTLSLCLSNLQALEYPVSHLNIVVVDGGSSDNSLAIAQAHQVELIQGYYQEASQARNAGAALAEFDYLMFVDADYLVPRDLLAHAVEHLMFYELYASCTTVSDEMGWIGRIWSAAHRPQNGFQHTLVSGALIVSKAHFDQLGGFNTDYRADSLREFCLRAHEQNLNLYHDSRTVTIDHDPPQSLFTFYQKEVQHHAATLSLFRDHGLRETAGDIALYLGLFFTAIALVLGLLGLNAGLLLSVLITWPIITLLLAIRRAAKVNRSLGSETKVTNLWRLTLLYSLSLLGRAVSLIRYHQVDDLIRVSATRRSRPER